MEVSEKNRKTVRFESDLPSTSSVTQNEQTQQNMDQELKVGDSWLVKRTDSEYHFAEIIQVREKVQDATKFEYLVHYEGCNRRLDEWVDRERFDFNNINKERIKIHNASHEISSGRKITRNLKRKLDQINHVEKSYDEMDPTTAALEKELEEATKVKYIDSIEIGRFEINCWYFSPYPVEFGTLQKLWICEFCLKYMSSGSAYGHHKGVCPHQQPPGTEIYRKKTVSMYEVDGVDNKLYCQNLCLLSRLFLDHKTLFYAVESFLFYVLTEVDKEGAHFIGYFSKQKDCPENNLACIMILPCYQRKGYGKFLIEFSYELSKKEQIIGSPEKPLSDLGRASYRRYWAEVILNILNKFKRALPIKELSQMTSITEQDIKETLQLVDMIQYNRGQDVIKYNQKDVEELLLSFKDKKSSLAVDPRYLIWKPPYKQMETKKKKLQSKKENAKAAQQISRSKKRPEDAQPEPRNSIESGSSSKKRPEDAQLEPRNSIESGSSSKKRPEDAQLEPRNSIKSRSTKKSKKKNLLVRILKQEAFKAANKNRSSGN